MARQTAMGQPTRIRDLRAVEVEILEIAHTGQHGCAIVRDRRAQQIQGAKFRQAAQRLQTGLARDHVERGAALRPRFREPQPSVIELERGQHVAAAQLRSGSAPMQPAGDLEMQHEP